jgi:hypothetical protein
LNRRRHPDVELKSYLGIERATENPCLGAVMCTFVTAQHVLFVSGPVRFYL